MASSNGGGVPDDVQTLFQKQNRMKFFINQFEEELDLLEKVKDACSDLASHKEKAKHLSLYGPGQPSQIQLKLELNEWMTAQNNALMKQDIIEVYLKDYRRQMTSYEAEIIKRGYFVSSQGTLVAGTSAQKTLSATPSVDGSSATESVAGAAV